MTTKQRGPEQIPSAGFTRRDVLSNATMVAVLSLTTTGSVVIGGGAQAEAAVLSVLRHREAASQIGNAALESLPQLRNRAFLLTGILDDLGLDHDGILHANPVEIGKRLSQSIQNDFAVERTVMLDGWLLSLTETRLYALAALGKC